MPLYWKRCLGCGANLEPDSLVCTFCGAAHLVSGDDLHGACPSCGTVARPDHKACGTCGKRLLFSCPECGADNALGTKHCHECQIAFATYRDPHHDRSPNLVASDEVAGAVALWLDGRWFKARDIGKHLKIPTKVLYWLPVWRFRARAVGRVEGQESQTHYRNRTRRRYDSDAKKWVSESDSEPYKVWNHVGKDFEETIEVAEPAARAGAEEHYKFLKTPWNKPMQLEPVPPPDAEPEWERRVEPLEDALTAYHRLHTLAEQRLRSTLLERVELLEARWFEPRLALTHFPVWEVHYQYKAKLGKVHVDGTTRRVKGDKITIFSQWFG